ncbi:hypothetical protein C8F04DRAFT_1196145 [Mycena alexandri]|uniref:Uncharacterized protein n=1 Tax=Mycena alexandri TaxID=1745969 RepID=A0AAD6S6U9_9AGAR|nr:hypothetical protein C8F04DRAFT_1196145 [Mycena alexandri]
MARMREISPYPSSPSIASVRVSFNDPEYTGPIPASSSVTSTRSPDSMMISRLNLPVKLTPGLAGEVSGDAHHHSFFPQPRPAERGVGDNLDTWAERSNCGMELPVGFCGHFIGAIEMLTSLEEKAVQAGWEQVFEDQGDHPVPVAGEKYSTREGGGSSPCGDVAGRRLSFFPDKESESHKRSHFGMDSSLAETLSVCDDRKSSVAAECDPALMSAGSCW